MCSDLETFAEGLLANQGLQGKVGPWNWVAVELGTTVVPFCPFYLGVSLLKLNIGKKGTLIINGLLGNLVRKFNEVTIMGIDVYYV